MTLRTEKQRSERGPRVDVVAGVRGVTPYLGYVLNGTEPHEIRPRRRKALRFIGRSGVTFARRVRHPGTRAQNFMLDALKVLR